jgi:hypothetical protein
MIRADQIQATDCPVEVRPQPSLWPGLYVILSTFRSVDPKTLYLCGRKFSVGTRSKRPTIDQMQVTLYENHHSGRSTRSAAPVPDLNFVERLRASHRIPFSIDAGWRIVSEMGADRYVAEKSGLRLWVDRNRHIASDESLVVGQLVTLRVPPDRPSVSPGFFSIVSGLGWPDPDALGRFYCNLKSESVCEFLGRTTASLEAVGIRYYIKTLDRPEDYGRRDGTVLYVNLVNEEVVSKVLRDMIAELSDGVNPETPTLALPLGPGLSFAHEPLQKDLGPVSFGQHRCRVLAEALWLAHKRGYSNVSKVAPLVAKRLRAAGIDPARPYLNISGDYENSR